MANLFNRGIHSNTPYNSTREHILDIVQKLLIVLFVILWALMGFQLVLIGVVGNENAALETQRVTKVQKVTKDYVILDYTDEGLTKTETEYKKQVETEVEPIEEDDSPSYSSARKIPIKDILGSKFVPYRSVRGNLYYSDKTNCILYSATLKYTLLQILPWFASTIVLFILAMKYMKLTWVKITGSIMLVLSACASAIIDTGIIGVTALCYVMVLLIALWVVNWCKTIKKKN